MGIRSLWEVSEHRDVLHDPRAQATAGSPRRYSSKSYFRGSRHCLGSSYKLSDGRCEQPDPAHLLRLWHLLPCGHFRSSTERLQVLLQARHPPATATFLSWCRYSPPFLSPCGPPGSPRSPTHPKAADTSEHGAGRSAPNQGLQVPALQQEFGFSHPTCAANLCAHPFLSCHSPGVSCIDTHRVSVSPAAASLLLGSSPAPAPSPSKPTPCSHHHRKELILSAITDTRMCKPVDQLWVSLLFE